MFNIIYTAYQVNGHSPDIIVDDNDYKDQKKEEKEEEEEQNDLNESVFSFKNIINEKSKEMEKFKMENFKNALKSKIEEHTKMIDIENIKNKLKEFEKRLMSVENRMNLWMINKNNKNNK